MKAEDIEMYGLYARGKAELLAYARGEQISRGDAILAKCYECNGGYVDGARDCELKDCPLYGYMPYNKNKYKGRPVSDEQKEASRKRMELMHKERRETTM